MNTRNVWFIALFGPNWRDPPQTLPKWQNILKMCVFKITEFHFFFYFDNYSFSRSNKLHSHYVYRPLLPHIITYQFPIFVYLFLFVTAFVCLSLKNVWLLLLLLFALQHQIENYAECWPFSWLGLISIAHLRLWFAKWNISPNFILFSRSSKSFPFENESKSDAWNLCCCLNEALLLRGLQLNGELLYSRGICGAANRVL